MLTIHADGESQPWTWRPGTPIPADTAWLDLCDPDAAEIEACEEAVKLKLPAREDLAGIGLAGRNRCGQETLFLQISRFADSDDDRTPAAPIALILTPGTLVTQRYAPSPSFEIAAREWHADPSRGGASNALAELMETMTERTADAMQKMAGHVADLSAHLVADDRIKTHKLRRWIGHVVKLETALARTRSALLGLARIVVFTCEKQPAWLPREPRSRIAMVRNDLVALDRFDGQLTEKLQFLLDAIFGLISVNQNSVMKVFTVVSVVAVPPVILAGIWGMNFKAMPELAEPWGYAMALGAIALSVLIPLGIFKWRGWLSND